mmetsp:Transcript_55159/g.155209  ORF Transcript_55159/g.155209 Transcript_55159/m.155209 type:complete len:220 (-) Transcript_55159:227-886(-)
MGSKKLPPQPASWPMRKLPPSVASPGAHAPAAVMADAEAAVGATMKDRASAASADLCRNLARGSPWHISSSSVLPGPLLLEGKAKASAPCRPTLTWQPSISYSPGPHLRRLSARTLLTGICRRAASTAMSTGSSSMASLLGARRKQPLEGVLPGPRCGDGDPLRGRDVRATIEVGLRCLRGAAPDCTVIWMPPPRRASPSWATPTLMLPPPKAEMKPPP